MSVRPEPDWRLSCLDCEAREKAVRERIQQLRAALLEYGRHKDDCVFWLDDDSDLAAYGPNEGCTCGFYEAALAEESHTPQETTG